MTKPKCDVVSMIRYSEAMLAVSNLSTTPQLQANRDRAYKIINVPGFAANLPPALRDNLVNRAPSVLHETDRIIAFMRQRH